MRSQTEYNMRLMAELREQVLAAVPGEELEAATYLRQGPGLLVSAPLMRGSHYLALTRRHLLLHRAGALSRMPGTAVHLAHRQQVGTVVREARRGLLCPTLVLQFPGQPRPLRFDVPPSWRPQALRLIDALRLPARSS
ncbi:hypothetical protein ACIRBX_13245 [Kitasatospora sp. NPDC096147]|uniref:hypothetical protein n=1 Tax=Kitasatospora sp. NPDC096147 TaxID=3364093 RepID=UPI0037FA2159